MKVGDLVFDHDLGRSAIILEVLEGRPSEIHPSFPLGKLYYRVMYDDGIIDSVVDHEVKLINEDR